MRGAYPISLNPDSGEHASMSDDPLQRYRSMVWNGVIAPDTAQELAAEKLQLLANRLRHYGEPRLGALLFGRKRMPPEGLYLHGGVGRGKTMLLDLFFEAVAYAPKRRVHFQEFMAEAHEAIDRGRKAAADPIAAAADEIASTAALLCFDELEVTDIADAMILGRLFQNLFQRNVVIVATSNSAPRELYRGGLNRQLFLPTMELIESRMEVHELEAARDYRLERLQGSDLYLTPADARAKAAMDASFRKLTGRGHGDPMRIELKGRFITVPEAALGVARFSFADLCEAPRPFPRIYGRGA
jgi:cell division protein ZapE